jgi:hypothetical protein
MGLEFRCGRRGRLAARTQRLRVRFGRLRGETAARVEQVVCMLRLRFFTLVRITTLAGRRVGDVDAERTQVAVNLLASC